MRKTKRNYKAIHACRKDYCERCGRPADIEPHHVFTRGAGGQDIPENLIQLCTACHIAAHDGRIRRDELIRIVADREQHTEDYIFAVNRRAMGWPVDVPEN